ncbi:MAG: ATP-binding protein [Calditrichia bacterium]
MKIAVASGKGGTGKTTIAVNLVLSVENANYLDCDVEEPNGHLFLNPDIEKEETVGRLLPEIGYDRCNFCGDCAKVCEYNAITVLPKQVLLFEEMCHSCGACAYFCPQNAIKETEKPIGILREGKIYPEGCGFVEGRLNLGEMMASPLISHVKAKVQPDCINILDAPPGTSCSMVETIRKADYCLLVTEPTPFGLNDLKLAVEVLRIVGIPFGVVINKADAIFTTIEKYCKEQQISILMKLPFDRKLAEAYSRGEAEVRHYPELKSQFHQLLHNIETQILKRTQSDFISPQLHKN